MSVTPTDPVTRLESPPASRPEIQPQPDGHRLAAEEAATYAGWFACLAEPTRVRLLHAVASAAGETSVGELTTELGISQANCSHHLRRLADVGFVHLRKDGTATRVSINAACCAGLPHAADAVMGLLAARPCCPTDLPDDVAVRAMRSDDFDAVRRIYAEGIATGNATFEPEVPTAAELDATWLPDHRWIAETAGDVAGWAVASPVSSRACYSGVAETAVSVGDGFRGRGVGKALVWQQVTAADTGRLWTLQTAIFPENKPGLALHHAAGYRTIGIRERIARLNGQWRDTILLERRRPDHERAALNPTVCGDCDDDR